MNRKQYIEKLVAIARLKWHITEAEQKEMELLLDLIPDKATPNDFEWDKIFPDTTPYPDITPYKPKPKYPWDDVAVMYGVVMPDTVWNEDDKRKWFEQFKTTSDDNAKENDANVFKGKSDTFIIGNETGNDIGNDIGNEVGNGTTDSASTVTTEDGFKRNGGKKFYTNGKYQKEYKKDKEKKS